MTQPEASGQALPGMSIGVVLDTLRADFPDVTISKIRFLEAEGLVTPQRTASGYRRFTAYDCARLRFILTAQRDHYLPLKVIKAQLDAQPDGELPHSPSAYATRLTPVGATDGEHDADHYGAPAAPAQARLSRDTLLECATVMGEAADSFRARAELTESLLEQVGPEAAAKPQSGRPLGSLFHGGEA